MRDLLGMINMLMVLIMMMVLQVYSCSKMYKIPHFKYM